MERRALAPILLALVVLSVMASACSADQVVEPTTTDTANEEATTTTVDDTPPPPEEVTFRIGLASGITTDNWWASLDTHQSIANDAFLGNGKTSLFVSSVPGFVYIPAAAASDMPEEAVPEGDVWVVEQRLRRDMTWSDGRPLTAADLVFYFDTVREFDLGGKHAENLPSDVLSITAPDASTVRIEFASDPGLAVWETGVGFAPFVPSHYWAGHVEAAREAASAASAGITPAAAIQAIVDASLADDVAGNDIAAADVTEEDISTYVADIEMGAGRAHLYGVSGVGEPSVGASIVSAWEPGQGGVTTANPSFFDMGTESTFYGDGSIRVANAERGEDRVYGGAGSGDVSVTYLQGPFVSEVEWIEYDSRATAYEQLYAGEIDFVFDPSGVTTGLRRELATNPGLEFSVSQGEGFRYMAFNLRKAPMSDLAFRAAIAAVIDKEFVANDVLDGVVVPAYTIVHPELTAFHNAGVAKAGWTDDGPMDEPERLETAIQILSEAGYTWATKPVVERDDDGAFVDVVPGAGLTMPNGVPVPPLTLLSSGEAHDPYRATYATWIEHWMTDLGVTVVVEPSDFESIVEAVFPPQTPESALAWDIYILGWGGAEPSLPGTSLTAFFHSNQDSVDFGGYNTPGYRSPEFDAVADAFLTAETIDEAAVLTRDMEAIVARDLPYVVLFRTRVVEAYHRDVSFPVNAIVGGHHLYPRVWMSSVKLDR